MKVMGDIPLTARTRKIIELAKLEAHRRGLDALGTEHLVYAMLVEGESVGAQILFGRNITAELFAKAMNDKDPRSQMADVSDDDTLDDDAFPFPMPNSSRPAEKKSNPKEGKTPALNTFGRDLTALAKKGELDPVIGRKTELERIIQVLSRRSKNNAVLIGEAGVGKTAVVEGLAQLITLGDVP
jgi:ATP-dependent Clp protease ATP-binding subunit ClpC